MSKMKYFFLPAAVYGIIALASCQKKDNTPAEPATNTELLSKTVWKYDTAAIDSDNNGSTDIAIPPGYIEACDKDNTFTFVSDGTGAVDEGPSRCNDSDPQSTPFSWAFGSNETVLNFTGYEFSELDANGEAKILSLTDNTLKLSKEAEIGPLTVHIIITLKH